jgi:ligand-binding SRPBCC domain-containing protein
MNEIIKKPLHTIGYDFVSSNYLPAGKDEYHLRNIQNRNGIQYRNLTAYEIEVLVRNNNTSDNWNKIHVSDQFNPELVKNCKFYGLVRIGKLETIAVEYHNVRLPVGLYNSTIISCDFGDNVVVNNVNYLSHYILGNEVMISNVHELHVTDHAKFGNGIIKDGEDESIRIWVEVCNENGGRKIIPYNGMLPGDAYIWAKYRDDEALMQKFKEFTEKKFDKQRGYYGKVGDRTVIKNTSIMKDVWIGTDAYIKGANKLKNLTINSSPEAQSQIGEGCELVNGIIGYGCRIFYGVKAVRFVMASHSQLKYGARLINSFLGNNSTISCCEVLNSLIFPGHEQHHNNSFLCAALVMGQSNIAAGATIGSNHNSRAADGEMVSARGFWPGLCVSLKHNSKFASFTLLAKGDYPAELNISIPFSLVSNDVSNDRLIIMPAYWFLYNLYALARNSDKYTDRDKRTKKIQRIEYDFLAPDTINEIFNSFKILKEAEHSTDPNFTIKVKGFENSNRVVELIKVKEAFQVFVNLIKFYCAIQFLNFIEEHQITSFDDFLKTLPNHPKRTEWVNIGGQLMPQAAFRSFIEQIKSGEINSWDHVHEYYQQSGKVYTEQKLQHAYASLLELLQLRPGAMDKKHFRSILDQAVDTKEWMIKNIYDSRSKDYQSEFRKMVYDNEAEMEQVIGTLDDNSFIDKQKKEFLQLKKSVSKVMKDFSL